MKTIDPYFTYAITREMFANAKDKTDCPACLVDDCNELDMVLAKIYSHEEKTHRCLV